MTDKLNCSVCLDVLYEPMEHRSCGNIFCKDCLKDVKICPLCRDDFVDTALLPVTMKFVLNAISEVHFKCPNCQKKVKRDEEKTHLAECETICEHCEKPILMMQKDSHQAGECEANCRQCWKKIRPVCMLEHLSEDCPYRQAECPASTDGCEWKGMARDINGHEETCKLLKCKRKYEAMLQLALKGQLNVKEKTTYAIRCNAGQYLGYCIDTGFYPTRDKNKIIRFYFESTVNFVDSVRPMLVGEAFRIKYQNPDGSTYYFERSSFKNDFGFYFKPKEIWTVGKPIIRFKDLSTKVLTNIPFNLKQDGIRDSVGYRKFLTIDGTVRSWDAYCIDTDSQMICFEEDFSGNFTPVMIHSPNL